MARREGERWPRLSRTAGATSSLSMASALSGSKPRRCLRESWLPAVRASVRPMRRCAGVGGLGERRGRSGCRARHGPRAVVGGDRGRGRGNRRFVARVGSRRRALVDRRVGGMRLAVAGRSGERARSRRSRDFSGGVSLSRPDASVCPLGFMRLPKPGRPCPQRQTPIFFRRCRGALFVSGASAGLFSSPRTSLHRQTKKLASCRPPLCYGPPPPPDGRRLRVQARSLGQAFRDRTEGNKPASGRRNPRPR